MLRLIVSICIALNAFNSAAAQMTFAECFDRLVAERQRVKTYVAEVTSITWGQEQATTGESWGIVLRRRYKCTYDASSESLLINRSASQKTGAKSSGVLLMRGGEIAVGSSGVLTTEVRKIGPILLGPDEDFLNPMLLGIAGQAEMRHFVATKPFFESWKEQARRWRQVDEGENELTFKQGSESIVIDKRFGFGVTQYVSGIKYESKSTEAARTCKYKKIEDIWLPVSSRIESDKRRMTVVVDWMSLNQPIDQDLFDPKRVASQAGLKWQGE